MGQGACNTLPLFVHQSTTKGEQAMITQTAAKHTPGPWSYNQDEGGYHGHVISTGDYIICDLPDAGDGAAPHTEANARLIAAAPDMLSLLKRLNEAFYVKGTHKALLPVMAETKPLIARAKGR
jgi:hypothetical protein